MCAHVGSKNIIAHVAHFCNVNLCKTYFTEWQIKGFVFRCRRVWLINEVREAVELVP